MGKYIGNEVEWGSSHRKMVVSRNRYETQGLSVDGRSGEKRQVFCVAKGFKLGRKINYIRQW